MRVATKYPRIAAAYFERTGRQAEIVEVKGSVELAPLTGLVHGIVDLTATGTTLRENGLVIREEIAASTARLIANPVAHKLKAAAIDDVVARIRAPAWQPIRCSADADRRRGRGRGVARSACPPGASVADAVREIVAAVRAGGDEALLGYERRFGGGERPLRVRAGGAARRRSTALDPDVRAGLEVAIANVRAVAEAGAGPRGRRSTLPQGHTVRLREQPGGRAPRSTSRRAATRTRRRS